MQNRASFNMSPVENMSFFQKEIVAGVYLSSYLARRVRIYPLEYFSFREFLARINHQKKI